MPRYRRVLAKIVSLVLLVAFPQFLVSCTYYHLAEAPRAAPLPLEQDSRIVLHQQQQMLRLASYALEGQLLTGVADTWGQDHPPEATTSQSSVAQEVHLFLSDAARLPQGPGQTVAVPLSGVEKVMVYRVSAGKTTASWGGVTLGVTVAVVVALLVVALSQK